MDQQEHAFIIIHSRPFGPWCTLHERYCSLATQSPWVKRAQERTLPTFSTHQGVYAALPKKEA